ncbi:carboxymuconolactone decarboxylase family protein [Sutterella sp.]|uniref:carboxymuconolactone decarboxylase family protein n=1 Tax=Sutterella sp. TaxID=1981025 RepID=UPI0026DF34E1|nr:carboxymuconolactone decarboxylase family protein [Sutterella sp.]MDO5532501.1 carboxymuconolactone decarboxylase family protein [Sutterella sp.]
MTTSASKSLSRRQMLCAGTAAGAFALAGSSREALAAAPAADPDPDFTATLLRMTDVKARRGSLSVKDGYIALLSVITAIGLEADMERAVTAALDDGLSPDEVKETVYQATPYCGMARVAQVLPAVNAALTKKGVKLPLASQATVTDADRFEKGRDVQVGIYGDRIRNMHRNAAPGQKAIIVDDLSGWCFGDYYTRKVLDLRQRELVTFVVIAAMGGCEGQLRGHTSGNITVGATKQNLIDAIRIAEPYLGFPRTLNALGVVNQVLKEE